MTAALITPPAIEPVLLDDAKAHLRIDTDDDDTLTAVGALVGDRIYDAPPRDAAFPYVTIGQVNTTDWSTATEAGAEHQLTLHAWSRERGKRECYAIAGAVEAALHDAALTLDGHALVNLRFEFAETRRDPDGITYHAAIRFRAVTEPA